MPIWRAGPQRNHEAAWHNLAPLSVAPSTRQPQHSTDSTISAEYVVSKVAVKQLLFIIKQTEIVFFFLQIIDGKSHNLPDSNNNFPCTKMIKENGLVVMVTSYLDLYF